MDSTRGLPALVALLLFAVCFNVSVTEAAAPSPPLDVKVQDVPDDEGTALDVYWKPPTDADENIAFIVTCDGVDEPVQSIVRRTLGAFIPSLFANAPTGVTTTHREMTTSAKVEGVRLENLKPGTYYFVSVRTMSPDGEMSNEVIAPMTRPVVNWFIVSKSWFAIVAISVCGTILICTELARRGRPFYVRPVAGLRAIDEAVGRATEMGRPILFIPGIEDLTQIDTVAGLTLLSNIAKIAAEYDTPMEVPTARTLVMTAAREAVQSAALAAGRPDYYNEDNIHYITNEQFGFVASVCGWMSREQPAACFYLGKFFAESLFLSEAGNAVGAIQIAGTAETTQLPFFVAACDYTLLGEELFAASAYLSGEPAQLGMLKGQDLGKLAGVVLILLGCALATWDSISPLAARGASGAKARTEWLTTTVLKGG